MAFKMTGNPFPKRGSSPNKQNEETLIPASEHPEYKDFDLGNIEKHNISFEKLNNEYTDLSAKLDSIKSLMSSYEEGGDIASQLGKSYQLAEFEKSKLDSLSTDVQKKVQFLNNASYTEKEKFFSDPANSWLKKYM